MSREETNAIEEISLAVALKRGLGRAVLKLEAGDRDVAADRESILHACRTDLRYDHQCEECRAPYLFDVLHATGEPEFYTEEIGAELRQLHEGDEDFAWHQMIEIAARFVRMGRADLRPVIYASVARLLANGGDAGASTLVRLDGVRGYRFVLKQVAHLTPKDAWNEEYLLSELVERIGESQARRFSQRLSAESDDFAAYLERAWSAWEESARKREQYKASGWQKNREDVKEKADYGAAMAWVNAPPGMVSRPSPDRISRHMNAATARRVAADLLAAIEPARQARFLRLFWEHPFPFDVSPLIGFARNEDKKLAWHAARAVKRISDPAVRAYGLELVDTPDRRHLAPMLLINNPGAGDLELFRDLLDRPFDDLDYHRMAMDLRDYFKANPTISAADCLLKIYERGPCSMCRYSVVKILMDRNALPGTLRRECRYDAYSPTRELIGTYIASVSED